MSATETDLNLNKYIGLSFPLRAGGNQDFQMTKTSLEQAQHNIRNLILTYPGERVNQPEFGCRLRDLLFEQYTEDLTERIKQEIQEAISEEHTSELQSRLHLVCRLLLEKKKNTKLTNKLHKYNKTMTESQKTG